MVLQVDDAEKEGHNTTQRESDVLRGVVIALHRRPDFEDANDVGNGTGDDECNTEPRKGLIRRGCAGADGKDSCDKTSGVHRDKHHGDIVVNKATRPVSENQTPDPHEKNQDDADEPANDHYREHDTPVKIRRQWNDVLRGRGENLCRSWNWNIS